MRPLSTRTSSGSANYRMLQFAVVRGDLCLVKHVMEVALVKTLAQKLRISVSNVYRKYRTTCRVGDHEYAALQVRVPTKRENASSPGEQSP